MEVREILKRRRLELGLTMKDVAKACGVSEAAVSKWESGDVNNMRRDRIYALSRVLQISPLVILGIKKPEEIEQEEKANELRLKIISLIDIMNDEERQEAFNMLNYILSKRKI